MVDPTPEEQAALRSALSLAAEIMGEIGWTTRLSELSEAQALTMIEAAVGGFDEAMRDIAAQPASLTGDTRLMLDFNHSANWGASLNDHIDQALQTAHAAEPRRTYLGGSRVGHPCERALQFEYVCAPKDDGAYFSGQTLRIFAIGHALEDLAVRWLRAAGLDLYTRKGNRFDGEPFGFSVASGRIRGHVDGIITAAPGSVNLAVPAIWECKTMKAKTWRETVKSGVAIAKPIYAAQIAIYQAYMDAAIPGVATNPALFTAINKDTAELYHEAVPFNADLAQRMSDRAVRVLQATDSGELLPRISRTRDHVECRRCPWAGRCWTLSS